MNETMYTDEYWMAKALELAERTRLQNEVPVGAVLVMDNMLIAEGWNQPIGANDPTAHAEIIALRAGAIALNNYRLPKTTLYVTLEPCVMCVGAMIHARIERLVFGAIDPKSGAVMTVLRLLDANKFNHRISYKGEVLAAECGKLLSDFFKARR